MADDTIRILLVDDHVMRAGLRALLEAEQDMRVVGEASTGEEGIERTKMLNPDVVVMDLTMPGAGGLEATRCSSRRRRWTRTAPGSCRSSS